MTAKQTALFSTFILIFSGLAAGLIAGLVFKYFTLAQIGIAAAVLLLIFAIRMVYTVELDRAQRLEELNKTR